MVTIRKRVYGKIVTLALKPIKKYKNFTSYQVYKVEGKQYTPIYTETYTEKLKRGGII